MDLDDLARALEDADSHVVRVLVLCGGYVDRHADDDPEAAELAHLLATAFDTMRCVGIDATTALDERTPR